MTCRPSGPVIVPLALWRDRRAALLARGEVGVWLAPNDDPEALVADVVVLPLIAVDFPKFTDGRGYSIARLLRDRHGFRGELRAIGDVLRDQLFLSPNAASMPSHVRADRDPTEALASLGDFAGAYQLRTTSRTPQPWFRRRAEASCSAPDSGALDLRVARAVELLRAVATRHSPAVYASSLGAEEHGVLTDLIARHALPIRILTLDTGRLPEETLALIDRTRERYAIPIDIYAPDAPRLEAFVGEHGVNAFYRSVELRKTAAASQGSSRSASALAGNRAPGSPASAALRERLEAPSRRRSSTRPTA